MIGEVIPVQMYKKGPMQVPNFTKKHTVDVIWDWWNWCGTSIEQLHEESRTHGETTPQTMNFLQIFQFTNSGSV